MKPLYLKFVNTGVANIFEFKEYHVIEMNWRLKLYPDLFNSVLMHEIEHYGKDALEDFKHDMKSKTPGLFKFMAKHISTLTQVLPFYWDIRRNKVVYDISYILSWIMIAGITTMVFFLTKFIMGWLV